ncbi:Cupredoxin [Echria macrotheca]|uniref:Cupredoxin n=1 Tax=Echria macrotheca TaxID=438768 RepID=A0AAJ0B2M4_9PEZI|nr:Cupredoxin [Echria macrotheca]
MLKSIVFLAAAAVPGLAALVEKNWDIEWVSASPDGVARPVIGINGAWPLPTLEATVGDKVRITINNKLGNESTGIHWHGIHQIYSNQNDGPAGATQCGVPPGKSFVYEWTADYPGTYWYHGHTGSQYPDGLRGPIIIHDPKDVYKAECEAEYLVTASDWYRAEVPALLASTIFNTSNTQLRPPLPASGLINDGKPAVYKIEPGKKYKFRIVNMSAFAGIMVFLEDHDIEVIEVDGVPVAKKTAKQLYITPAQRYAFIVTGKASATKNYGLSVVFDINPDYRAPVIPFNINATGELQYDASKPAPAQYRVSAFDSILDDTTLTPLKPTLLGPTDVKFELDFNMGIDASGVPRATVNGKPYVHQKVPTLYSVLSTGADASNPLIYGQVNPFIAKKDQVVELVLNNLHFAHHPFHFHGHHFQVCERSAPQAGKAGDVVCVDGGLERDTLTVEAGGSAILRFKADNPGVWLLHCHIEWHVPLGLSATIIEDVAGIQKSIKVPKEHFEMCAAQCLPWEGNAGGNKVNHTDLSNANTPASSDSGALYEQGTCKPDTVSSTASGTATGSATSWPTTWTSLSTSTLYSTKTYTVTSCAPTVTNCPAKGHGAGSWPTSAAVAKPSKSFAPANPESDWAPWVPATTLAPVPVPAGVAPTGTGAAWGTGKPTATSTGKGMLVTAGAAKVASGFGAAALVAVAAML